MATDTVRIPELIERCRNGNAKLWVAWRTICDTQDPEQRQALLEQWDKGHNKLLDLNTTLKALGFEDCLYIDKNKKKERYCLQGDWCWVCPSAIKYWKWEWDELPSASGG